MEGVSSLDYALNIHFEEVDGNIVSTGYTIRFFSRRAIERAFEMYNIVSEPKVLYRFVSKELFESLRDKFGKEGFMGIFGDDSWPLYAIRNRDYWESIYGIGYIEKTYPLYGHDLWESAEDLMYGLIS